jgi:hypothetical protein
MKLHRNAALTLNQRRRLARRVVEEGWSLGSAAAAAEVGGRTARKWVDRSAASRAPRGVSAGTRSAPAPHSHPSKTSTLDSCSGATGLSRRVRTAPSDVAPDSRSDPHNRGR